MVNKKVLSNSFTSKSFYIVKIFFTIFTTVCFTFASGKNNFNKTFGGDKLDRGIYITQTSDGNYIALGYTGSYKSTDEVYLIKIDKEGNELWSKTYGGDKDNDFGWTLLETDDKGFIISGWTGSFGAGGSDVYFIRTDSKGDTLWTKAVGGTKDERVTDIIKTYDGNYVAVGQTESFGAEERDGYLIKINDKGDVVWTKTYGDVLLDRTFYVKENNKHELLIAGITKNNSNGGEDVLIIKTDENGNTVWQKNFGYELDDVGHDIILTSSNEMIVSGYYQREEGKEYHNPYFIKLSGEGEVIWEKRLTDERDIHVIHTAETGDGNFVAAGYLRDNDKSPWDCFLMKLNKNGEQIWMKTYGEKEVNDLGYTVSKGVDGGFVITGYTYRNENGNGDFWIFKVDNDGNL